MLGLIKIQHNREYLWGQEETTCPKLTLLILNSIDVYFIFIYSFSDFIYRIG